MRGPVTHGTLRLFVSHLKTGPWAEHQDRERRGGSRAGKRILKLGFEPATAQSQVHCFNTRPSHLLFDKNSKQKVEDFVANIIRFLFLQLCAVSLVTIFVSPSTHVHFLGQITFFSMMKSNADVSVTLIIYTLYALIWYSGHTTTQTFPIMVNTFLTFVIVYT